MNSPIDQDTKDRLADLAEFVNKASPLEQGNVNVAADPLRRVLLQQARQLLRRTCEERDHIEDDCTVLAGHQKAFAERLEELDAVVSALRR